MTAQLVTVWLALVLAHLVGDFVLQRTAVLAGSPTGVGLVVAAKSVFRFEDAKRGRHAAEYFLIGTFLCVSEAVVGGVVAGRLLAFLG